MEESEKKYKEIVSKRKDVLTELFALEDDEKVKRYLELIELESELKQEENEAYIKVRKKNFKECRHLTVYTKVVHDYIDGKRYSDIGCIKCGIDTSIYDYERKFLSPEEQAMYDYLKSYSNVLFNSKPKTTCDLQLGVAIYSKIKERHPDIDDKTAKKYFEIALDNIREIPVSEARKESRAKRLGLKKEFTRWNESDVTKDY